MIFSIAQRPGVLRFMGLQRAGHDWVTELNWTELIAQNRGVGVLELACLCWNLRSSLDYRLIALYLSFLLCKMRMLLMVVPTWQATRGLTGSAVCTEVCPHLVTLAMNPSLLFYWFLTFCLTFILVEQVLLLYYTFSYASSCRVLEEGILLISNCQISHWRSNGETSDKIYRMHVSAGGRGMGSHTCPNAGSSAQPLELSAKYQLWQELVRAKVVRCGVQTHLLNHFDQLLGWIVKYIHLYRSERMNIGNSVWVKIIFHVSYICWLMDMKHA